MVHVHLVPVLCRFDWMGTAPSFFVKCRMEFFGLLQKKSASPRQIGFWKFSGSGGRGGPKAMEIQEGGGLKLKKSSLGLISSSF